ncbi:MAG: hypothetical protein RLZ45_3136 [Verrucomicrobiota bacterium]|jgi:putative phosphoribosyl transferase
MPHPSRFRDRIEAGRALAQAMRRFALWPDLLVLGLPRGGVPVAAEVARELNAPLDVLIVRKLGVPGWEELAFGAIASPGVRILNEDIVAHTRISEADIRRITDREQAELRRRELLYRGHVGAPDVTGRTVVVVDDGMATGATVHAAVLALREQHPGHLLLAVPIAPRDAVARMRPLVEELVVLRIPDDFVAVGQGYEVFDPTSDQEVRRLLAEAPRHRDHATGQMPNGTRDIHPQPRASEPLAWRDSKAAD